MEDITVQELKARKDKGEALIVIDVREPHEYAEFNLGGKLIPLGDLAAQLDSLEDHKEKEIIVHCRSGARSAAAKAFLTQNGFLKVRNLLGGVVDWINHYGTA